MLNPLSHPGALTLTFINKFCKFCSFGKEQILVFKIRTSRSYSNIFCYLSKRMFSLSFPFPLGLTPHCSMASRLAFFPLKELVILSVTFLIRHSGGLLCPLHRTIGKPQGAAAFNFTWKLSWRMAGMLLTLEPQEGMRRK